MQRLLALIMLIILSFCLGCNNTNKTSAKSTLRIAAAASLEKIMVQRLIPMFENEHPKLKIEGTYAGSGKLQTQIEQGLKADIFIPAATKQMDALKKGGYIVTSKPLLQNELVLIVPKANNNKEVKSFQDFVKAKHPAIGDPKSVPAGLYALEALQKQNLWQQIQPKASLGTNVVEVLNWVAEGSADAGLVYATDAAGNAKVKVVAAAPKAALSQPIVYPIGILKTAASKPEAAMFVEFLESPEAQKIFQEYGFKAWQ